MPKVALYSGTKTYFFCGDQYIRVTRGETGPGTVDPGYPKNISVWGWGSFGANGIDAALHSGPKTYFFCGDQYIRVTRGDVGPGTVDPGYPQSLDVWGWGTFARNGSATLNTPGIDAALNSGSKDYFFSGDEYIRVTRGDTGAGTVDAGYPKDISVGGWGGFGADGTDAALHSGSKTYFFSGDQYLRVTRGDTGAGTIDPGYPRNISVWGWPTAFRNCWAQVGSNFHFDNGISADRRARLLERQRFAFSRVGSCGSLSAAERGSLSSAYRRPIWHGITTNANANASAFVGQNQVFVNFANLFPDGDDEIAQSLVHEVTHCAGFTHPDRCDQDEFDVGTCSPVDVPGDGGDYYGSPPLRAEICIAGNQSDQACFRAADGRNLLLRSGVSPRRARSVGV